MQRSTGNLGGTSRLARTAGFDLVCLAIVSILLAAEGLKGCQPAISPVVADSFLDVRWLLIAMVEFGLFSCVTLLTPIWPDRGERFPVPVNIAGIAVNRA
jgi:hypothetical protein